MTAPRLHTGGLLLGAGMLSLFACTSESTSDITRTLPPPSAESTTTPRTDPPADEPIALPATPPGEAIVDGRANGLILVLDAQQRSLDVLQVDGTHVATLSGENGEVVLQPVWSPDGRRVAWARSTDGAEWELTHAAVDGTDAQTIPLPGQPDYLAFDPTSSLITALTPSPLGFGLVVAGLSADDEPRVVDVGRPYFTDFSPEGDRIVAHVGTDVRIVDVAGAAGETLSIGGPSTTHQTPQWHPDDDVVVYTVDEGPSGGQLVQRRVGEEDGSTIADFDGFLLFDLDPTGRQLAVSSLPGEADPGTPRAMRRRQEQLAAGLSVIDLVDGSTIPLADRPTTAPLWDPTGTKVLVRDALAGVGQWTVHHVRDGRSEATDSFSVDDSQMPLYLRFWDQYVRSHSAWSPDGEHFVHVGAAVDGRSGVWVHDASMSGPSAFLADGDLALWSPT